MIVRHLAIPRFELLQQVWLWKVVGLKFRRKAAPRKHRPRESAFSPPTNVTFQTPSWFSAVDRCQNDRGATHIDIELANSSALQNVTSCQSSLVLLLPAFLYFRLISHLWDSHDSQEGADISLLIVHERKASHEQSILGESDNEIYRSDPSPR